MEATAPGYRLDACYRELGLREAPFRITPDTQFFFPHSQYLSAIGHLRYGMLSGGFTVLTGEVGLGKTMLCRYLLRNLPGNVRAAFIYNPQQSFVELMRSIIHDLSGVMPEEASQAALQARLLELLEALAQQQTSAAVLVDEAHRLNPEVLEGLRLLSNLESEKQKLMSLLLVGQTELERQLKRHDMRALRQRIAVWHRLRPFGLRETMAYISHRMDCARQIGNLHFTRLARMAVHHHSRGVPRHINLICDRALMNAFVDKLSEIGMHTVDLAARDVSGPE